MVIAARLPTHPEMPGRFFRKLRLTLEMIKFEHSVFALPFALTGALLAARESALAWPAFGAKLIWMTVAMVGARSAAMTFNRLADERIDSRNPRTRTRHLPTATLSRGFAWGFLLVNAVAFFLAAWRLNPLCLRLASPVLAILLLYSYTKRFTSFSHLVLGFCLGMAPAAAWIAVTGALDARVLWLTAAVTLWTAGFDVIYACQDFEFDGQERLFSIPRRFGIGGALWISRLFHIAMVGCLLVLVNTFQLGRFSLAGVGIIAALLIYEHGLVRADDLSRVDAAFFTVNGYVSVLFFLFWAVDIVFLPIGVWP